MRFRRFLCWLLGHRGPIMLWNPERSTALFHLGGRYAGTFATCARCEAAAYDDLGTEDSVWGRVALPLSSVMAPSDWAPWHAVDLRWRGPGIVGIERRPAAGASDDDTVVP